MSDNQKVVSSLLMDRSTPIGNSQDPIDGRGQLHVKAFSSLINVNWKWFTVTYPTATQEIYRFYDNSSLTTLLATVELNYQDSTKEVIVSGGDPNA